MAIMDKNQALFPFEGDMHPIAIMDGNNMIYEPATSIVTGESASFLNTYNHHFNSLIADGAEPQSLADWHGVSGALSQVSYTGKNLFNKGNYSFINGWYVGPTSMQGGLQYGVIYLPCLPNTTYSISVANNTRFLAVTYATHEPYASTSSLLYGRIVNNNAKSVSITTGSDALYLAITCYNSLLDVGFTFTDQVNSLQVETGMVATSYEPYVGGASSPNPLYPQAVTPNILAGSYKIARPAGGWWTITLTDDVRGISTYADKIELDLLNGKGKDRRKIKHRILNGSESWNVYAYSTDRRDWYYVTNLADSYYSSNTPLLCTHYPNKTVVNSSSTQGIGLVWSTIRIRWGTEGTLNTIKAQLADSPVDIYYPLATETVTNLTLTHVDTSDLPELTLADLGITVSSLDYPFTIYESNNNFITVSNATEVKQTVSLPTLRAIGTAKDRFDILSGVKTHKVSEWITIPQPTSYALCLNLYSDFKRISITQLWDYNYPLSNPVYAVKYDGKRLSNQSTYLYTDCIEGVGTDTGTRISVSNIDSGWSVALTPSAAEIKAYFLGWQMCHDDGSLPYYKSEVPYTPETWAEWLLTGAESTKSIDGVHFVQTPDGTDNLLIPTNFKSLTKYGFLYEVTACTLNSTFYVRDEAFPGMVFGKSIGNNKVMAISKISIPSNSLCFTITVANTTGTYIDFKDIRVYELPPGSQIEADFTNLTADQLAIKYPFYGLNPKNWKHVTDGLGKTATLPTATYAGYTPYRLLYQLATPAEEQLAGTSVPTYPWHTDIAQTGDIKTAITAKAKVMD